MKTEYTYSFNGEISTQRFTKEGLEHYFNQHVLTNRGLSDKLHKYKVLRISTEEVPFSCFYMRIEG